MTIAWAQEAAGAAAPAGGMSMLMGYLPIILIFAVFYFLILRPQSQAAKAQAAMIAALGKGEDVLLTGGLMGRITKAEKDALRVQINAEDEVLVVREAVARKLVEAESKQLADLLKAAGKKK